MSNAATFYANPNAEKTEPWIERAALEGSGFRIWHVMLFSFTAFLTFLILICCCIKLRIPRTKQEIEANYRRKKLVEKFRQRIKLIQNQDIDAIDLQTALSIIQEDYKTEVQNLEDYNLGCDVTNNLRAEPQRPSRFNKIMNMMKIKPKSDESSQNNEC